MRVTTRRPVAEFEQADQHGPRLALQAGLGFRLSRLARNLRRAWTDALAPLGLSPPQSAVLRGVAEDPGCSLRALARTLDADPMNVKRCVDQLEARGLISSGHSPADQRPRKLALTEAGHALTTQLDRLARAQQDWLSAGLTATRARDLDDCLGALERHLSLGAGLPASPETDVGPFEHHRQSRDRKRSQAVAGASRQKR